MAAVVKNSERAPKNRRGAPEAVEKRRAARAFNDLLTDGGKALDGRTEKRRRRLLEELRHGKKRTSGRELKPVEVLTHVNELLDLGEPMANIKKACGPRKAQPASASLAEAVTSLHKAYGFRTETYRFVGIDDDVLRAAGVLGPRGSRRRSKSQRPPR